MDMVSLAGARAQLPAETVPIGYRTKRRQIAGEWPVFSTPVCDLIKPSYVWSRLQDAGRTLLLQPRADDLPDFLFRGVAVAIQAAYGPTWTLPRPDAVAIKGEPT
jgi:hypothetical protein